MTDQSCSLRWKEPTVHGLTSEHLQPAVEHEHTLHESVERILFVLLCSSYALFPRLQAAVPAELVHHPVMHIQSKDNSCVIMYGETAATTTSHHQGDATFTQSVIPHVLNYHESINMSIDTADTDWTTFEVSVGLVRWR